MELNREEIIKALECCHTQGKDCLSCPYENDHSNCVYLDKNALSLINELIEGIKARDDTISRFVETMPLVKADTVRKMQTEIEARCIKGGIYPAFVRSTINKIAEEMIGGDNAYKED